MNNLKDTARDAIVVQDGCNLCGIVQAFARAMLLVRENTNGTAEANTHAVAVLFADKIFDLVGRPDYQRYGRAYDECKRLAAQRTGEPSTCLGG